MCTSTRHIVIKKTPTALMVTPWTCEVQCPSTYILPFSTLLTYRGSILKQIAGFGCFCLVAGRLRVAGSNAAATLGIPDPRLPRRRRRYCVRGLWAARRAPLAPKARISSRRSPNRTRAKACYKMVQIARGYANHSPAQQGGDLAEPVVIMSIQSSRDTRVHTARYGSSRRR
jgi:hypothetical protein